MVAFARPPILTIGHSNHEPSAFVDLLRRNQVTAVVDVRSSRRSRFPQFNEPELAAVLKRHRIYYVPMGDELGARRVEAEAYTDGTVDFDKVLMLPMFRDGIRRLVEGASSQRIALMCAERDPLDCHRTLLVCRALRNENVSVAHILHDGSLEEHADAESRLLKLMNLEPCLFDPDDAREGLILRAYQQRGREIGYRKEEEDADVAKFAS
jgi:uncharacterized protein (DUF488 family)